MTVFPHPQDVALIEARMAELALENEPHVPGQHTVSKCLLARWATKHGSGRKLISFNLATGKGKPRPPATCTVDDFIKFASASAERMWGEVETRLPEAIKACENGTVWDRPEMREVIMDAIARHVARSVQVTAVQDRVWAKSRADVEEEMMENPALLTRVFKQRYRGLVPAGPESLLAMVRDLYSDTVEVVGSGQWQRSRVERLFDNARRHTRAQSLQLVRPEVGEFLIGDVPALTRREGHPGVGVLGGVALMDASTIFLPLGPHLIAALSNKDGTLMATADTVRRLNGEQVIAAQDRVYMRIGSGLDDFVTQLRPPTIPQPRAPLS
jgi:hypothetical protein